MITKRIVLKFPRHLVEQPIIYKLSRDYNLIFNILRARVTPKEEGELVLELRGKKKDYTEGLRYIEGLGVKIQPLSKDIIMEDTRCIQCGVCTAMCPTSALYVERNTMKVAFNSSKCIACEMCIEACPAGAMKVKF